MRAINYLLLAGSMLVSLAAKAQVWTFNGTRVSSAVLDRFIRQEMDSLHMPALYLAFISRGKIVCERILAGPPGTPYHGLPRGVP